MARRMCAGWLFTLLLIGCTRVVVRKAPGPHDHGFRFYRPKPYLFIGPSAPQDKTPSQSSASPGGGAKGGGGGGMEESESQPESAEQAGSEQRGAAKPGGETDNRPGLEVNNFIKVVMEIKYLPDYNEEYSVKLRPGIGTGTLSFKLDDGWNLTSVNMQTDQKLPELLTSIASLVGAVRGSGVGGSAGSAVKKGGLPTGKGPSEYWNIIVDTRPDVPLGFYEPIIATDPHGRKSLFGWRYVGFLPFAGCPVEPCLETNTVTCSPSDLWGIVATPNSIKFERLSDIENGKWPYKYKTVYQQDLANKIAEPGQVIDDAPPPNMPIPPIVPRPSKPQEKDKRKSEKDQSQPTGEVRP